MLHALIPSASCELQRFHTTTESLRIVSTYMRSTDLIQRKLGVKGEWTINLGEVGVVVE